jgi:hypothetical protein
VPFDLTANYTSYFTKDTTGYEKLISHIGDHTDYTLLRDAVKYSSVDGIHVLEELSASILWLKAPEKSNPNIHHVIMKTYHNKKPRSRAIIEKLPVGQLLTEFPFITNSEVHNPTTKSPKTELSSKPNKSDSTSLFL